MGLQDRDYYRDKLRKDAEQAAARATKPATDRGSSYKALPGYPGAAWPWPVKVLVLCVLAVAVYASYRVVQRSMSPGPVVESPSAATPGAGPHAGQTLPGQASSPSAQQAEAASRAVAEAAAKSRRDAQFSAFYKPSYSCQQTPGTVDCANEYIRARRQFDLVDKR